MIGARCSAQALRGLRSARSKLTYRQGRLLSTQASPLSVSQEVEEAIRANKPVVALETTIYTHGFPYPDNIALSSTLESLVRKYGAVPATIGVLNGVAKVGMEPEEIIELLEKAGDPKTIKVSRRDLGFICARKDYCGGTTIAGTLVLAHLAGIKVFATGGLGGVHRDRPGETSMDVSADLTELGRTPLALVSSGCKSFLDLPRTLEFLETQGVGVGTFADGREGPVKFPAFWTRESDITSPNTIKDEKEAAAILHAQLQLPLESGLLFANPIPLEYSLSSETMNDITSQAVKEAAEKGILGSANTPYILSRIRDLTEGGTIGANRKLIEGNVIRGTKLAVELAKLEAGTVSFDELNPTNRLVNKCSAKSTVDVLVAGSIAIDLNCNYEPRVTDERGPITPVLNTSNPASIQQTLGGVGQNVATASHYMGARTILCSIIGDDGAGKSAKYMLSQKGMRTEGVIPASSGARTAQYVAVNDLEKDLVVAMADMKIFEIPAEDFDTKWKPFLSQNKPKWAVLDANWSPYNLTKWILAVKATGAKVAYEPVSVAKSIGLLKSLQDIQVAKGQTNVDDLHHLIDLATPNQLEVQAMSNAISGDNPWATHVDRLAGNQLSRMLDRHFKDQCTLNTNTITAALRLLSHIPCILTKLGANGVLQAELLSAEDPRHTDEESQRYILHLGFSRPSSTVQETQRKAKRLDPTSTAVYLRHHPTQAVKRAEDIVSVNGVGDTLLGALVAILSLNPGVCVEDAIDIAQAAAVETLMSPESVSPGVSRLAGSVVLPTRKAVV